MYAFFLFFHEIFFQIENRVHVEGTLEEAWWILLLQLLARPKRYTSNLTSFFFTTAKPTQKLPRWLMGGIVQFLAMTVTSLSLTSKLGTFLLLSLPGIPVVCQ